MLFKALVLQKLYGLSDEQWVYQINDHLGVMRFLDLSMADKVPDQKTFWHFRNLLTKTGAIDDAFVLFRDKLREEGYIVQEGRIVDASIISAPVQRHSRDENCPIKEGNVPEGWSKAKREQKAVGAAWTTKGGKHRYGYKNPIKIDAKSKLIDECQVTPAHVHDSLVLEEFLDETDAGQALWADSAYDNKDTRRMLRRKKWDAVFTKGERDTLKCRSLNALPIALNRRCAHALNASLARSEVDQEVLEFAASD